MDWIKLKSKTISSTMTDSEIGKLVRYLMETSRLERPLNDIEISRLFGGKRGVNSWNMTVNRLQLDCNSLVTCLLDDCKMVDKLRERNRVNKRNSRLKEKNVTADSNETDNIREDNIIYNKRKNNYGYNYLKENNDSPTSKRTYKPNLNSVIDAMSYVKKKSLDLTENEVRKFWSTYQSSNWKGIHCRASKLEQWHFDNLSKKDKSNGKIDYQKEFEEIMKMPD